jgi:hypothetical protein
LKSRNLVTKKRVGRITLRWELVVMRYDLKQIQIRTILTNRSLQQDRSVMVIYNEILL